MNRVNRISWAAGMIVVLGAVAGCGGGGGGGNPLAPNPGGGGNQSARNLVIAASVAGLDTAPGTFNTDFTVSLTDTLGAAQSGARVSISDSAGTVALTEDPGLPGTYRASRAGYTEGTYTLDVTLGSAQVTGVTVAAPDLHTITSPTANETIQANRPIQPSWSRTSVAQEAVLETKDYRTGVQADDGRGTIPAPGNPPRNDQRVSVTRFNRTLISGAGAGSTFEASIRNSVEPVIAQ